MGYTYQNIELKQCSICNKKSIEISEKIGVCRDCILNAYDRSLEIITKVRSKARANYSLPLTQPKAKNGLKCGDCVNNCKIPTGEYGFCKLVKNSNGKIVRLAGDKHKGIASFYHDSLPTNCVAEPFCPGCTAVGYPKFSYKNGPEYGYSNLAVFYQACTFDCLSCQNYHYRTGIDSSKSLTPMALVRAIRETTSCICFFGGDPAAQIRHSNKVAKLAIEKAANEDKIIRICWETNGSAKPSLMEKTTDLALISGGTIKIDFKSFDDRLNTTLCGSSNVYTKMNIKKIARRISSRPEIPLLVVSTLLIPGYIDVEQVEKIASFIAKIDPTIPLSLLAFHPTFIMNDLPTTSKKHAMKCFQKAKDAGLENVSIGNKHLLR